MKLHSDTITANGVVAALWAAKENGKVTPDIELVQYSPSASRSRMHGHLIQLGTYDKSSGPRNSRHYKNSGQYGAAPVYAATYDEWGWFIAVLFAMDPDATFGPYKGQDDFNRQTGHKYVLPSVVEV